mmetsp:Transcript_91148/g.284036  ORF Transcript_91148/g.284036 Transcript_91148/m.284036 type:complete len:153 (-) Transcript_91148:590-1048(-)
MSGIGSAALRVRPPSDRGGRGHIVYVCIPGAAIGPIGYRNHFGSAALRAHSRLGRGGRGHIYCAGVLSAVGASSGYAIIGPIGGTFLTGPAALRARLLADRGDTGRTVLVYVHGAGGLQCVLTFYRAFWDVASRAHLPGGGAAFIMGSKRGS